MNERHMTDDEIARAVAGLELDGEIQRHLDACLGCRRRVEALKAPLAARRREMLDAAPDWEAQREQILFRLDGPAAVVPRLHRRHWARALLAAAAVLIAALGLWLNAGRRSPATPRTDAQVERVLDQVNATLADDRVPGFEALDQLVPSPGEIAGLQTHKKSQG
ncbi:MAG: hypothetical protein GXP48_11350 [Acidobacteria bacterium]|nr:hypothetical protein [Acidobacteriota bacterium]